MTPPYDAEVVGHQLHQNLPSEILELATEVIGSHKDQSILPIWKLIAAIKLIALDLDGALLTSEKFLRGI